MQWRNTHICSLPRKITSSLGTEGVCPSVPISRSAPLPSVVAPGSPPCQPSPIPRRCAPGQPLARRGANAPCLRARELLCDPKFKLGYPWFIPSDSAIPEYYFLINKSTILLELLWVRLHGSPRASKCSFFSLPPCSTFLYPNTTILKLLPMVGKRHYQVKLYPANMRMQSKRKKKSQDLKNKWKKPLLSNNLSSSLKP